MKNKFLSVLLCALFLAAPACGGGGEPPPEKKPPAASKRIAEGVVTDFKDDAPLAGVTVSARGKSVATGADGKYVLEFDYSNVGDKIMFAFELDGYVVLTVPAATDFQAGRAKTINAALNLKTTFSGTVTDASGNPLNGVKITVKPKIAENPDRGGTSDTLAAEAYTDAEGKYFIGGDVYIFAADEYTLTFSKQGRQTAIRVLTVADGRALSLDINMPAA